MEELAVDMEEWINPSTEATHLNFTRQGAYILPESIHPTFTYAVFGDDEAIPGYKDLKISISFQVHDLKPSVHIRYTDKFPAINEQMQELQDVEGMLKKFLPESAFSVAGTNGASTTNGDSAAWKPPGELLHSYRTFGKTFEIWTAPLTDRRAWELVNNMRILIPFFIEGGTVGFLEEPEWALERWKVFLLYEVSASSYTIAGFSTSYRAWVFPTSEILTVIESQSPNSQLPPSSLPHDPGYAEKSEYTDIVKRSPLDMPCRERISQFIILPHFQKAAHGSWLYMAMMNVFRRDQWVFEITVEEPNEAFDALRDYCDLAYLNSLPQLPGTTTAFKDLRLPEELPSKELGSEKFVPTFIPIEELQTIRHASKIAPRQFHRCVEIHLLATIPPRHRTTTRIMRKDKSADKNDRAYYFWRLLVKERVFMKNRDQLLQIDEDERVQKLEETLGGVQDEYTERIQGLESRVGRGLTDIIDAFSAEKQANGGVTSGSRRKRKVISEEDDDEDEDEVTTKKAKPTDAGA